MSLLDDDGNEAPKLPAALCEDLKLHAVEGVPVVNSRDVAEMFEKRHDHVLRDVDAILTAPKLGALRAWFRRSDYVDGKGETRRSFDLTRDGFTLLVNRWTGSKALEFQIRYIEAFNAMELAIRDGSQVTEKVLLQAVREIVQPLAVRFDYQDRAIEKLDGRVDGIAVDVAQLKAKLLTTRRHLKPVTKAEHVDAIDQLGGRCPCCGISSIVAERQKSNDSEFDHFYASSRPDPDHTWLICRRCHRSFTDGLVSRDQREPEFRSYQQRRRRLQGRQISLF